MSARCGGCDTTWHGLRIAHCAAAGCHRTFSTPANFDKHRAGSKVDGRTVRVAGECHDPEVVGLVLNDRGYWAMPGRDEDEPASTRNLGKRNAG